MIKPMKILKNREQSKTFISSSRFKYKNLIEIGAGTFGCVYKSLYDNEFVAIKKYLYNKERFSLSILREIKALRRLDSDYIIKIKEIIVENHQIYLVMPYIENDLSKFLPIVNLTVNEIKSIFWQILKGVKAIHNSNIIHRDLKASNILIEKSPRNDNDKLSIYKIKICDFGISRAISEEMTPKTVTFWYRAPELLLGTTNYNKSIDIWSLGCILAEMLIKVPLFKGQSDIEQLDLISSICGSINSDSISIYDSYPLGGKYNIKEGERCVFEKFKKFSEKAADLLNKMLVLDPFKRLKIDECLEHDFFEEIKE